LSSEVGEAFQDTVPGPRNLRSKQILALGHHWVEDFGSSSTKHPGKRPARKKVCGSGVTALEGYVRTKRKRERTIEDCFADPFVYRSPQRRTLS